MQETSEGILLEVIPYLDRKAIFKVFTKHSGVIALLSRQLSFSPFCLAEWIYRRGKKDLYTLKDASLLHPLLELRQTSEALFASGALARALLRSPVQLRPDPLLYALFTAYLLQIPKFKDPSPLLLSFQLKLLHHEGMLSFKTPSSFSAGEWELAMRLSAIRRFVELEGMQIDPMLQKKVELYFEENL